MICGPGSRFFSGNYHFNAMSKAGNGVWSFRQLDRVALVV
jgi:hypothetical protein